MSTAAFRALVQATLAVSAIALPQAWSERAPAPLPRASPAVAVVGGVVYVIGGQSGQGDTATVQAFDVARNIWLPHRAPMPVGRYQSDGAGVINGKIYVAGGWTSSPGLPHNDLLSYDPATDTWATGLAGMPQLSGSGCAGVINGLLYVTTPSDGNSGFKKIFQSYDPVSDTWTNLPNSPHAHGGAASGVIGGKLYVAGGVDTTNVVSGFLDIYEPGVGWTTSTASMLIPRERSASCVVNGKLYVVGGSGIAGPEASTEIYDPIADTWTAGTSLARTRSGMAGATVGNIPYAIGGYNSSGVIVGTIERLDACASAASGILAWGDNTYGQCNVPTLPPSVSFVEVAAGFYHSVARCSDGSIVAWGRNSNGQCNVPALPPTVSCVEVAAGAQHSLARLSDGSIIAWGFNFYGECNVPALPPGRTYVEIAAGNAHSMARLSDGTVVAWGYNGNGQLNVPNLAPNTYYVQIAAGYRHSLGRCSDGSIRAWGDNSVNQCNVPPLTFGAVYVDVAAGVAEHSLARRDDGNVVAWGDNSYDQCNVPPLSQGATYGQGLAGGSFHSLACLSDGELVGWGSNTQGQSIAYPAPAGRYMELAAGRFHTLARYDYTWPNIVNYCTAGATTHACAAAITAVGTPSVTANSGFNIQVTNLEGQKAGLIFYGLTGRTVVLWGIGNNSYLCVKSPVQRTPVQMSGGTAGSCDGAYSLDFNAYRAAYAGSLGQPMYAGQVIDAEAWFRDPQAQTSTNLSNALEFTMCP